VSYGLTQRERFLARSGLSNIFLETGEEEMETQKKVFISQPMKGKTEDEILSARENALKQLKNSFGEFEIIDTYFKDFDGNRLEFLGKSVSKGLSRADVAVFIGDWERYDGCRCEQFIAAQYRIPCMYL
jgi:hypothetical protein